MNKNKFALYLVISVGIVWGFIPIIQKDLLNYLNPYELTFTRFLLSGISLLVFTIFFQRQALVKSLKQPSQIMITSLIGPVPGFLGINYALSVIDASTVIIITCLESAIVYAIAVMLQRERLAWSTSCAIAISFIGILFTFANNEHDFEVVGKCVALFAITIISLNTILSKSLLEGIEPMPLVALNCCLGACICLPFLSDHYATTLQHISVQLWLKLLFCTVIGTVIGFPLWYYALTKLPASKATITSYIQPIVGILLSYYLLGELFTYDKFLGTILVFLGMFLFSKYDQ